MMIAEEYLGRSLLFRRLKNGSYGQLIERYAARLVDDGLAQGVTLRSLRLIGDFMKWMASSGFRVAEVDEPMVERFLHVRARKRSNYSGDRPALKRFLSVLRDAGMISSAEPPQITPEDQILADFCDYLRRERGLAPRSIDRHLPGIRRLLCEVCPAGAKDLGKINHANVLRYVERHARDGSPSSGRVMCWSLRAFFRYLHHKGLNPLSLAGCVPSIRQWKFANLPTYLSAEQVRKVLDSCDRATAIGRRNYAILMMLAKLGLRAHEIVALTLDDIDWRSGEIVVRGKGDSIERIPLPPDVGRAVAQYLRHGRPVSAQGRTVFVRIKAPHRHLSSSGVSHVVADAAKRAGLGRIHAHRLRHTAAIQMLRAGASLPEIGQLLRHRRALTTAIYAKVDRDTLRTIARPWPGDAA